jgi:hypothetical protein
MFTIDLHQARRERTPPDFKRAAVLRMAASTRWRGVMAVDPVESLAGDGGVHGFAAAGKHRRSPVEHGEKPNKLRKIS